ncbi:bifunctional phosphopantothenoylcysteine decarboxylase/phosphopantothenate--cysteine ligase CoaBC [Macrococcus sp. DPC7161]|uniref:bifunctional phosphopantothenoylcysteine decarboxylase/phosphopantothenate--cysteine ligase CoaBC n=1 Tax=Macrococcus sp. DPC7161 TaxID=2507060 RepID=UPI00100C26CF|nr:bifunctional phosphopantothenoylcysteine decarboxylase/phosphopantothenate--cysteine ligase CoaBC [Macrococcus sp. DPC7161]RXK18924.1 bifunctional phosphopantothenoylcysteine decarboxylase/phosphopantothenate--cysteine ligase CoaBC [Macrococcus sp. DPC7161]
MKILLGVTGGIASYKAIDLTSKLVQKGHEVKVIMTKSAEKFVTTLPFQALSRNEVHTDIFDETDPSVIKHIDLADWADLILVAPITANTVAKMTYGIADNMLSATLLASTKPIFIAPAMNSNMLANPAVENNINILRNRGIHIIEPGAGFLACGYIAKGRMSEPLEIIEYIEAYKKGEQIQSHQQKQDLKGKKVMITAGPTIENIDPVRYLTNRSSGKMGYALANAAASRGADVTLISNPLPLERHPAINWVSIESAQDMFEAVQSHMNDMDIIIKAAAVADYTPETVYDQKLKKKEGDLTITFKRTVDILSYIGTHKTNQYVIGFAAETENVEENAIGKLKRKNADVIVSNNVGDTSIGFKSNENAVTMHFKDGDKIEIKKQPKEAIANQILSNVNKKGFK